MAARKRGARRTTGPAKVRIPGTNQWVLPAEEPVVPEEVPVEEIVVAVELEDDVPPEFAEPVYVNPDLGERPEPAPVVVETQPYTHYWHAWLPNLTVKRGRKDQVRFKGGIYTPRSAVQDANVRKALAKYVPGGDPDRWKGDTPGLDEDLSCPECGFMTANFKVWKDHLQHTQHDKSVRIT
jgi:hypothetical protein